MCEKVTHSLKSTLCWGHIPKYFRMVSMSVRMSYPLIRAVPDVGGNSPVRIDLPRNKTQTGWRVSQSSQTYGWFRLHHVTSCDVVCTKLWTWWYKMWIVMLLLSLMKWSCRNNTVDFSYICQSEPVNTAISIKLANHPLSRHTEMLLFRNKL